MKTPPLHRWLATMLLAAAAVVSTRADQFDTLRNKWRDYLLYDGNPSGPSSDPDIIARVAKISADANSAWGDRVTGTFSDRVLNSWRLGSGSTFIPSEDTTYESGLTSYDAHYNLNKTYARLYNLALGYAVEGTTLYQSPAVRDWLLSALDWLHDHKYQEGLYAMNTPIAGIPDGNPSFWWKIGIPLMLNDICALLYDEITANGTSFTRLDAYLAAVGSYAKKPAVEDSGANRVWECTVLAVRGVLLKEADANPTDYTPYGQTAAGVPDLRYARNHLNYAGQWQGGGSPVTVYSLFAYVEETGANLTDPAARLTGFYRDGAFIQHLHHPYTGGYGASLINDLAHLFALLKGSSWEVSETSNPQSGRVFDWVFDSYEPAIYKGAVFDSLRGRELSRSKKYDHTGGHLIMEGLIRLVDAAPTSDIADELKGMIKYWITADTRAATGNDVTGLKFVEEASLPAIAIAKSWLADTAVVPRAELTGHYRFPGMARVVHLRPGFGFGLSLFSDTVYNYESLPPKSTDQNIENKRGYFTADGMTTLYNGDLGQFSDAYWVTINPSRLPGITVDTLVRAAASSPRQFSPKTWTGGSTLGYYGVAGTDFKAADHTVYNATTGVYDVTDTVSLVAKKSWFMFDDEIVALGAGVTSTDGRTIETIIDNRRLGSAGTNAFTVDGTAWLTGSPAAEPATPQSAGGTITKAWLDGGTTDQSIGYYFPAVVGQVQPTVKASREVRHHAWSEINDNGAATPFYDRNYLALWFHHGSNPSGATYAYALLPNRTASQVNSYASGPDISVVDNTAAVQTVKESVLGLVAANFWTDGNASFSDILKSDKKASVILDDNPPGWLEVAVSDPTRQNAGSTAVELNRAVTGALSLDPGLALTQITPTAKFTASVAGANGASLRARFLTGSTDLFHDNINAYGSGGTPPAPWVLSGSGGTVTTVPVSGDTGNYTLKVDDTAGTGTFTLTRPFTAQNAPITVEFDARAEQTNALLEIGSLYRGTTQAAGIYFRGTGKIACYDGANIADTTKAYSAGTWYHFRIVAHAAANSFDLYVDGVFVKRATFRNPAPVLDGIGFGGTPSSMGVAYADNISVRQLASTHEEGFDAVTIGTLPAGWTKSTGASFTVDVQSSPGGADDRELRLVDSDISGSGALTVTRVLSAQTSAFLFEGQLTPAQNNKRLTMTLGTGSVDAVQVLLRETGAIAYYNGATLVTLADTYAANAPVAVRLVVNPATGTFDLHLNGVRKAAGAAFKNASPTISQLKFVTLTTEASTCYVDALRLCQ